VQSVDFRKEIAMAERKSVTEEPTEEAAEPMDVETSPLDPAAEDSESETGSPRPDEERELAAEESAAAEGPFTAPGADAEMTGMRETLRREFQSQKDREIQRERRRWDAEMVTLQGRVDERAGREDGAGPDPSGENGYETHLGALGAAFSGIGTSLRELPDLQDMEEPDWGELSQTGNFGQFVREMVDRASESKRTSAERERVSELAAAMVKDRLATIRLGDDAPDLTPTGAPASGFERIEERYVAGEVDVETYRAARRGAGLQD
jgi:hypothetical protein